MRSLLMLIILLPVLSHAGENFEYIPKGKHDTIEMDKELIKYYSKFLIEIKEPFLWGPSESSKQIEIYRFSKRCQFTTDICIRIVIRNSGDVLVHRKEIDDSGEIIRNEIKRVSGNDIQALLKKIDEVKLWNLKEDDFPLFREDNGSISFISVDEQYVFEYTNNKEYHILSLPTSSFGSEELNDVIDEIARMFLSIPGF